MFVFAVKGRSVAVDKNLNIIYTNNRHGTFPAKILSETTKERLDKEGKKGKILLEKLKDNQGSESSTVLLTRRRWKEEEEE